MADDYRDIGAADFVRFEKIRRDFAGFVESLNLVSNTSPGVIQTDPVVMTHELLPGFFGNAETFYVESQETLNVGAQNDIFIPSETDLDLINRTQIVLGVQNNYEGQGDAFVELFSPLKGVQQRIFLDAQEVAAPTSVGVLYGGRGQGDIGGSFTFTRMRGLRTRIIPPGYYVRYSFQNGGAPGTDNEWRCFYSEQPANIPFTTSTIP